MLIYIFIDNISCSYTTYCPVSLRISPDYSQQILCFYVLVMSPLFIYDMFESHTKQKAAKSHSCGKVVFHGSWTFHGKGTVFFLA